MGDSEPKRLTISLMTRHSMFGAVPSQRSEPVFVMPNTYAWLTFGRRPLGQAAEVLAA